VKRKDYSVYDRYQDATARLLAQAAAEPFNSDAAEQNRRDDMAARYQYLQDVETVARAMGGTAWAQTVSNVTFQRFQQMDYLCRRALSEAYPADTVTFYAVLYGTATIGL
jgi:hypothetical protein